MKKYSSNQEYFDELEELAARIERSGNAEVAAAVRYGVSFVNGLTDGWAMLMDTLELVLNRHGQNLCPQERDDLECALKAARKAVHRP